MKVVKKFVDLNNYSCYENVINLNEGKQGEINKIKNSNKPFGNIKFNNRVVKNHGRNETIFDAKGSNG